MKHRCVSLALIWLASGCISDSGTSETSETSGVSGTDPSGSGGTDDTTPGTSTNHDSSNTTGNGTTSDDSDPTVPTATQDPTTDSTSGPMPETSSSSEGSTTDVEPPPPSCSVEVVTHDELFDPLPRGEEAGVFPPEVAEAIEDYCGCHTLMNNSQNLEWPGLLAPAGSLILEYSDLDNPVDGTTLGAAMQAEIASFAMPPGSCPWPGSAAAIFSNWFDQGMPDGANYVPL